MTKTERREIRDDNVRKEKTEGNKNKNTSEYDMEKRIKNTKKATVELTDGAYADI